MPTIRTQRRAQSSTAPTLLLSSVKPTNYCSHGIEDCYDVVKAIDVIGTTFSTPDISLMVV
eukprot:16755-Heterococcus_DN1.PRE.2